MATWRKRYPDSFPAMYGQAVKQANLWSGAAYLIPTYSTMEEAQRVTENFRYWRWCIRQFPTYHLADVEEGKRITARVVREDTGGWRVKVEVKARWGDLIAKIG